MQQPRGMNTYRATMFSPSDAVQPSRIADVPVELRESFFRALKALSAGDSESARSILGLRPPDVDWSAVDAADEEIEAARVLLEEAEDRRSAALRSIVDSTGTGPYTRSGDVVRIVVRDSRRGPKLYLRRKL